MSIRNAREIQEIRNNTWPSKKMEEFHSGNFHSAKASSDKEERYYNSVVECCHKKFDFFSTFEYL